MTIHSRSDMITITNIIISETGKKINNVIKVTDCNIQLHKVKLNGFRKTIEANHTLAEKKQIIVNFIYKQNDNTGNNRP